MDMEIIIENLLQNIKGLDLRDENLLETPKRVANMWKFLAKGYEENPKNVLKVFKNEGFDELILLRDIEFYSVCIHHLIPFYGVIHVAYIPDELICGLSKIVRVCEIYSRRLQIQERLTAQITDCLNELLKPVGVMVVIEARHLCMMMRGIQKQNTVTVTSTCYGAFRDKPAARAEFLTLMRGDL